MLLLIDYRERGFLTKLSESTGVTEWNTGQTYTCNVNNINVTLKVCNLELGDFIITTYETPVTKDNENNLEGYTSNETQNTSGINPVVIIERKTFKDLCSSIIDGRFREQKQRIFDSIGESSTTQVLYIVEGDKRSIKGSFKNVKSDNTTTAANLSQRVIDGSILNLIFKYKCNVLSTENETDTYNNVLLLYKKYASNDFERIIPETIPVRLVSKSQKIEANTMAIQLTAIRGVSYQTASIISKSYPNMKCLVDAYNACQDDPALMLSKIQLTPKRTLGKALASKIYESIMK